MPINNFLRASSAVMAKCAACGKFLSQSGAATCSTCIGKYHKGCVGIPDCSAIAKDWSCPECKKLQRKGDNTNTPVKSIHEAVAPALPPEILIDTSPLPMEVTTHPPPLPVSSSPEAEIRLMRRELAEYMAEMRSFHRDFCSSIASMGERIDGLERRLEAVEQRPAPGTDEVVELQQTVVQLKLELNDREQEGLSSDLDIGHLPEEKGENIVHTVVVLAAKMGITVEDRDIVFAERVGAVESGVGGEGAAGGRARRVVVRLTRRRLRDDILHAARVRRNFTTADMGPTGPARRVYVNERLTRANRQLFGRVREECRKRHWRYVWTKRGRIYARQAEGKQVHCFRSEEQLHRVFHDGAVPGSG